MSFTNKSIIHKFVDRAIFILIMLLVIICFGCQKTVKKDMDKTMIQTGNETVNIVTNAMDFVVKDTLKAGWHTFKYDNRSNETHFFVLEKYPPGKSIHNTETEIAPVFQEGMNLINQGNTQKGFDAFNKLPEWFFNVVFVGGSGLISPGKSSLTTVKLDPGYYILECYVKMANGTFHSNMGMLKALIIEQDKNQNTPPDPTVNIKISSAKGIVVTDSVVSGHQVFSVQFMDQIVHENFVGHDINLVSYEEKDDLNVLEAWMNWADPKGLISPAPSGFSFMGGVNDMPEGATGYFEVDLVPGNYLLISEVPNAKSKNLLQTFTVH